MYGLRMERAQVMRRTLQPPQILRVAASLPRHRHCHKIFCNSYLGFISGVRGIGAKIA